MGHQHQNIYGLFIGVNRYESEDIRPLAFASADVLAVRDKLAERFGLRYENTVVLADDVKDGLTPTRRQILRAMNRFAAAPMQNTDLFMFVFAGHGFSCAGRTFLAACDSEIASEALLRETAVSLETIRDFLGQIPAGQQVLILDACRDAPVKGTRSVGSQTMSGDMTRDIGAVIRPTRDSGMKNRRASAILCSCWEGQVAHEYAQSSHGWFCHNLLLELDGAAESDLPVSELHRRVKERMRESAWRLLPSAKDQSPHLLIEGDVPVLRHATVAAGPGPGLVASQDPVVLPQPSQSATTLDRPACQPLDGTLPKVEDIKPSRTVLDSGISLLLQGGPAIGAIRDAWKADPDSPETNLALGVAFLSSGPIGVLSHANAQEAEAALRVALANPETCAAAVHALAALRHCFYMDHSSRQPSPDFTTLLTMHKEASPALLKTAQRQQDDHQVDGRSAQDDLSVDCVSFAAANG